MVETAELLFGAWEKEGAFASQGDGGGQDDGGGDRRSGRAHEGCQHQLFSREELQQLSFAASTRKPQPRPPLSPPPPPPEEETHSAQNDEGAPSLEADPHARVRVLEGRLAFLRSEHRELLAALQAEVEQLKRKNKDLQFQLVLQASSVPPATKDATTHTPVSQNADPPLPLVETSATLALLSRAEAEDVEAAVKALRAELHEARSRNLYLSGLVEEQNKKISELEEERRVRANSTASTVIQETPAVGRGSEEEEEKVVDDEDNVARQEYSARLQEAEEVIQQLRRENLMQRKELLDMRSSVERSAKMKHRGCNHPGMSGRRGRPQQQQQQQQQQRHPSGGSTVSNATATATTIDLLGSLGHSQSSAAMRRAESLDRFPPLGARGQRNRRMRGAAAVRGKSPSVPISSELPPVPGSGGSDASSSRSRMQHFMSRPPLAMVNNSSNKPPLPSLLKNAPRRWQL